MIAIAQTATDRVLPLPLTDEQQGQLSTAIGALQALFDSLDK